MEDRQLPNDRDNPFNQNDNENSLRPSISRATRRSRLRGRSNRNGGGIERQEQGQPSMPELLPELQRMPRLMQQTQTFSQLLQEFRGFPPPLQEFQLFPPQLQLPQRFPNLMQPQDPPILKPEPTPLPILEHQQMRQPEEQQQQIQLQQQQQPEMPRLLRAHSPQGTLEQQQQDQLRHPQQNSEYSRSGLYQPFPFSDPCTSVEGRYPKLVPRSPATLSARRRKLVGANAGFYRPPYNEQPKMTNLLNLDPGNYSGINQPAYTNDQAANYQANATARPESTIVNRNIPPFLNLMPTVPAGHSNASLQKRRASFPSGMQIQQLQQPPQLRRSYSHPNYDTNQQYAPLIFSSIQRPQPIYAQSQFEMNQRLFPFMAPGMPMLQQQQLSPQPHQFSLNSDVNQYLDPINVCENPPVLLPQLNLPYTPFELNREVAPLNAPPIAIQQQGEQEEDSDDDEEEVDEDDDEDDDEEEEEVEEDDDKDDEEKDEEEEDDGEEDEKEENRNESVSNTDRVEITNAAENQLSSATSTSDENENDVCETEKETNEMWEEILYHIGVNPDSPEFNSVPEDENTTSLLLPIQSCRPPLLATPSPSDELVSPKTGNLNPNLGPSTSRGQSRSYKIRNAKRLNKKIDESTSMRDPSSPSSSRTPNLPLINPLQLKIPYIPNLNISFGTLVKPFGSSNDTPMATHDNQLTSGPLPNASALPPPNQIRLLPDLFPNWQTVAHRFFNSASNATYTASFNAAPEPTSTASSNAAQQPPSTYSVSSNITSTSLLGAIPECDELQTAIPECDELQTAIPECDELQTAIPECADLQIATPECAELQTVNIASNDLQIANTATSDLQITSTSTDLQTANVLSTDFPPPNCPAPLALVEPSITLYPIEMPRRLSVPVSPEWERRRILTDSSSLWPSRPRNLFFDEMNIAPNNFASRNQNSFTTNPRLPFYSINSLLDLPINEDEEEDSTPNITAPELEIQIPSPINISDNASNSSNESKDNSLMPSTESDLSNSASNCTSTAIVPVTQHTQERQNLRTSSPKMTSSPSIGQSQDTFPKPSTSSESKNSKSTEKPPVPILPKQPGDSSVDTGNKPNPKKRRNRKSSAKAGTSKAAAVDRDPAARATNFREHEASGRKTLHAISSADLQTNFFPRTNSPNSERHSTQPGFQLTATELRALLRKLQALLHHGNDLTKCNRSNVPNSQNNSTFSPASLPAPLPTRLPALISGYVQAAVPALLKSPSSASVPSPSEISTNPSTSNYLGSESPNAPTDSASVPVLLPTSSEISTAASTSNSQDSESPNAPTDSASISVLLPTSSEIATAASTSTSNSQASASPNELESNSASTSTSTTEGGRTCSFSIESPLNPSQSTSACTHFPPNCSCTACTTERAANTKQNMTRKKSSNYGFWWINFSGDFPEKNHPDDHLSEDSDTSNTDEDGDEC